MLSVYTRHHPDCKNAGDKDWRRCSCPKWIWGAVNGTFIRRSARTHSWEEAEEVRLRFLQGLALTQSAPQQNAELPVSAPSHIMLSAGASISDPEVLPPAPKRPRIRIEDAVDAYLDDAVSRNVAESTLEKLETIFRKQFQSWALGQGFEYIDEIDHDALLNFRNTWKDSPLARQKKQSRVVGFFWACLRRHHIREHPALVLGKVKVVHIPTDYFPPDEFQRIIDATYTYGDARGGYIPIEDTRTRLRTMTLLMRWSGLRIRDAITLEQDRLRGDSLLLYQAKTGTPVYVPLPPHVVEALKNIPDGPKPNPRYFFWSGNGLPKTAVADWQRAYRRLFEIADIRRPDGERKRCHPHMFRDTFAVEMLLAGVPIDQVSLLLGHASVKITEKSYAPFVKARQIQLQESVRNAWSAQQPTGGGPENTPTTLPPPTKHAGLRLIHSAKRTGTR